jgi:hypothetical protein
MKQRRRSDTSDFTQFELGETFSVERRRKKVNQNPQRSSIQKWRFQTSRVGKHLSLASFVTGAEIF